MSKKILVYTIFRNSEEFVDLYYDQLKEVVLSRPDIEFYFSGYENDSSDETSKKLLSKDWSFFKDYSMVSENINSKSFNSVISNERIRNICLARNKAISAKSFIDQVDYVMMVEADIKYSLETINKILDFDKVEDFDIVSGLVWQKFRILPFLLYDIWATRSVDSKQYLELAEAQYGKSSRQPISNMIPDWINFQYARYYSTSNGICLYKAKPFQQGIRVGYISPTINIVDCEQVVLCEEFRLSGYDKIFIIHDALIEHLGGEQ